MRAGSRPFGRVLDHDCRNRACIRSHPDHLEPVASAETIIRSDEFMAVHDRKTNWPQGHPCGDEDLRFKPSANGGAGARRCRERRSGEHETAVSD